MTTTGKIASNTIYQIIGKLVTMSITIVATIIVTRTYGREGFGEFNLMQTWPALFFIIIDFGINAIATRELSKDPQNKELEGRYFGTIVLLRTIFSIALIIVLSISLLFFPYSASLKFGIILSLFQILTQGLFATTNIIFQTQLRYDFSTLGNLAGYALILILILVFSTLKLSIVWIGFSYVLGGAVTYMVTMRFLKKLDIMPIYKLDTKLVGYLITESFPLGLMFIFSQINFKSDNIFMSVLPVPQRYGFNNTETVAIYGLAYKIFEVALVVPTFLMNSIYPVMVRQMTENGDKLRKTFTKTITFLFISGVVVGLAGIVFSPLAINILGGSEFETSIPVLKILLGGLFLYYLTQPISWLIVTLGNQKYLPRIYLFSAAFNVIANYLYIPKYSFFASSIITHISEVIILVALVYVAVRAWKLKYAD